MGWTATSRCATEGGERWDTPSSTFSSTPSSTATSESASTVAFDSGKSSTEALRPRSPFRHSSRQGPGTQGSDALFVVLCCSEEPCDPLELNDPVDAPPWCAREQQTGRGGGSPRTNHGFSPCHKQPH